MELYRCYDCRKLTLSKWLLEGKICKCGSRKVTGASPSNLFEHLQLFWWSLIVRES
jgi:hypothetical protein